MLVWNLGECPGKRVWRGPKNMLLHLRNQIPDPHWREGLCGRRIRVASRGCGHVAGFKGDNGFLLAFSKSSFTEASSIYYKVYPL